MESRTHHLAKFVVLSPISDQDTVPEQLRHWILLRAPAQSLAGVHQQKAIGFWPDQNNAAEAGKREREDIAELTLKRF
jgi:hypothetical protein